MREIGGLKTNAMGILPHSDIDEALDLAFTLDIPFWPQLPNYSYYEDMYVQFSEHFPGIRIDTEDKRVSFDSEGFYEELESYIEKSGDENTYDLSEKYSVVYRKFLERDLSHYPAVKGQVMGPVSFGLRIIDENRKPMIFNDEVRTLLFDFTAAKINHQYKTLREKNKNPIVYFDEPGLELVFNSISGYTSDMAKQDVVSLMQGVEGLKGIHLCGNPDWDFLLTAGIDILSFDTYRCGSLIVRYDSLADFLKAGRIISWGIVPTDYELLKKETVSTLMERLEGLWAQLTAKGIAIEDIIAQSQLAPATCNLIGAKSKESVEKAYGMLNELSLNLKKKYGFLSI